MPKKKTLLYYGDENTTFFKYNYGLANIYAQYNIVLKPINDYQEALKAKVDLLLLRGGSDVHPVWYGKPVETGTTPNFERDIVEWVLVKRAIEEGIPTLGICRGMQLINVALGGTLYQDINAAGISSRDHRTGHHSVRYIQRSSWPTRVNSRHHQAIDRLGSDVTVLAYSKDEIPEMVMGGDKIFGVQCHPEDLLYTDRTWESLFHWHAQGLPE